MLTLCMDCKRQTNKAGEPVNTPIPPDVVEYWKIVTSVSHGLCTECHIERKKELAQYRKEKEKNNL